MNKKVYAKKCKLCHGKFLTKQNQQKFCSVQCRNKYHAIIAAQKKESNTEPKLKKCEVCGAEFERKANTQKYCSSECAKKAYRNNLKSKNKKRLRNLVCQQCGKTFNSTTYVRKYCDECAKMPHTTKKGKKKRSSVSINEIARLCREAGLSYGQYVAQNNL